MGTSDLKNCAAHFLEDEPCRAPSAFQIHEEIAQAIASEIKTGKSGNIALIGNWGSGKSTIVNRVQELLQSESGKDSESGDESTAAKKGFIYFKFDAWAHSGDSLRRNFLSGLADRLEEQGELSEEEKRRIDDRIHGRTSSSTIKEDTSFAPLVSASIVATATYVLLTTIFSSLLPLGRTILVACGILTPDTHTGLSLWSDFISLLVAAALFVCVWRVSKFDGPPHNKKEPTLTLKSDARQIEPQGERDRKRERAKRAAKILTDIFSRNADTTTVSKRNDSPVLDSLAFEEIYEELAISAEETIVIVFDNLDRLDSKGLQEAWGTLQIFANHFDQGPLGRQFALTQPHAQKIN